MAKRKTWREQLAPHIAQVIEQNPGADKKELNRLFREKWHSLSLGIMAHHPYKIWRDEIRNQTGAKRPKSSSQDNPNQLSLL